MTAKPHPRAAKPPLSQKKGPAGYPVGPFHRKELERRIIGVALGALCVEQLGTRFVERGILA